MGYEKLKRLAALLLAVLLLCGCSQQPAGTGSASRPAQTEPSGSIPPTEPTQPTEPVPEVTRPAPTPEPDPAPEAITYLDCISYDVFPQLLSLGGGRVIASRNTYNPVQGIINCMEIINVYTNEVEAKAVKAHTMELVLQNFSDGAILMAEPDSGMFYVYDQTLTMKRSFAAPNLDGFFTYDRSGYYFIQDSVLHCMNVADGSIRPVDMELRLRFETLLSIHHEQERLVAKVYLSDHGTECGIAVIDAATGKVELLRDDLTHVWLTDEMFYGLEMNSGELSYDVYYGSLGAGEVLRIPTQQLYAGSVSYAVVPGCHYLVRLLAPDDGDRSTTIYDLANGAVAVELAAYDFNTASFSNIYLQEENLLLGYYSQKEPKDETSTLPPKETFHLVLINPEKLTFGPGATPETAPWQERVDRTAVETAEVAVPDALAAVRAQADKLEKKYGIEILIGHQAMTAAGHSLYTVAVNEDPNQIEGALQVLDAALAQYPQGLPAQLRNGAGEGGLSFCLTGAIKGGLKPAGFTQQCRDRYELVLDITAFEELDKTIHHEMWHAIEMYLSADTFQTEQWNACNPEGFDYYGSYDKGYLQLTKWTFTGGAADVYFVDPYARINGREDRACIMESIMTGLGDTIATIPALKEKLQIMADAIRNGFDDAGWSDVWWEQYL